MLIYKYLRSKFSGTEKERSLESATAIDSMLPQTPGGYFILFSGPRRQTCNPARISREEWIRLEEDRGWTLSNVLVDGD